MTVESIVVELITPKQAEKYLNKNIINRALRAGVVEKYAADMKNGNWTRCPAPIVFYDDGDIADGQHRLFAISESGTAQRFTVHRGLPREAGLNIDTHAPRNLPDNAKIAGLMEGLTTQMVSIARAVEEGERGSKRQKSNAEQLATFTKHEDAVRWAVTHGPKTKFTRSAAVLGAIARCRYHETDEPRLKRFCEVLHTGFYDSPDETAAIALREYLKDNAIHLNNTVGWRDTFLKVQNALYYFMRKRPLSVIRRTSEEHYPLPTATTKQLKPRKAA